MKTVQDFLMLAETIPSLPTEVQYLIGSINGDALDQVPEIGGRSGSITALNTFLHTGKLKQEVLQRKVPNADERLEELKVIWTQYRDQINRALGC